MGIAIHVISCLACLQAAHMFPMQAEGDPALEDFRLQLAKRHIVNPYKDSLFSSLGFYEAPKGGAPSQRKKAVDSTFIRFGRSSLTDGQTADHPSSFDGKTQAADFERSAGEAARSAEDQEVLNSLSNLQVVGPHLFNPEDCRVNSRQDLVRLLLTNRNCLLLQKAKRASAVNDTFIRFGKREAPNYDSSTAEREDSDSKGNAR